MSDEMQSAVESVDSSEPVGNEAAPVGGGADAGVAVESGPFFEWEHPKTKEKLSFKNKGELADHLLHSSMRKSDLDAERQKYESRMSLAEQRMREAEALKQQLSQSNVMKYDAFLKKNPHVVEALKREMSKQSGSTPDVNRLLDEKLKPVTQKLQEYEKREQEAKVEQARKAAFERLKGEHQDVDEKAIQEKLKQLGDVPEGDREYQLLRLLHHAVRGEMSPAEYERRRAQMSGSKRPPSVTSTPSVKTPPPDARKLGADERRAEALKLLEGMGGE